MKRPRVRLMIGPINISPSNNESCLSQRQSGLHPCDFHHLCREMAASIPSARLSESPRLDYPILTYIFHRVDVTRRYFAPATPSFKILLPSLVRRLPGADQRHLSDE